MVIDELLGAAFRENPIASIDSLKRIARARESLPGFSSANKKEVFDLLGTACLVLLRLEEAARYFQETGNAIRLGTVFELAIRHGRFGLVKELVEYGREKSIPQLQIDSGDYLDFLKRKALPYVPMHKYDDGFAVDEKIMDAILSEIGEPRERLLAETVRMMEALGSRNLVKKFILAYYSGDTSLTQRYEAEFNRKASGGRQEIVAILEKYCRLKGLKLVKCLQEGDYDNYFPSVAHIFLIEENGKAIVLKENVRLHQDYSRLSGYSMEKEILEAVRHENIVRYAGSLTIEGIEFLVLGFMPGVTLEKYVQVNNLLPVSKIIAIIRTLAGVIDFLHRRNIISMDIKDKNVMYDGSQVSLFDFGVSQLVSSQAGLQDDTFITSLLTTPEYVAPEMALTFKAYPKTDIFQLGLLFYKLLVGKNPFVRYDIADFVEGDEYRESEIIKFVLPALFREIDEGPKILRKNPAITALLKAMLRKDFRQRPHPREVVAALDAIAPKEG